MVGFNALIILLAAAGASLFMAWTIGAGSSGATPFAPAVGANAISVMRAGFVVGILGFAGAIFQGANVSEAVGRNLIRGAVLSPVGVIVALVTAATLVAIGVYTGYPIATAFTVTGAVVGVGLALGGDPAWSKYREIASVWLAVPFVGGTLAYVTARLLRNSRVPEERSVPTLGAVVGLVLANIEFVFLGQQGESASLAVTAANAVPVVATTPVSPVRIALSLVLAAGCALVVAADVSTNTEAGQRRFLLALGGLVAFSAGGSQVGLAVGPLLPLQNTVSMPLVWLLVGGGFGLLLGSWTGAPRMIKALSQDFSSLGPRRSIAALIPAFVIAQTAILLGIPVSFNEIIVSTIVGSGYAAGSSGVSRRKMVYTVAGWAGSLIVAFTAGYSVYSAIATL